MELPKLNLNNVTTTNLNYEFVANVSSRFFKVLFRSDKKIKMIYSNCTSKHSLGDNFVIVDLRFKNALWYKLNDVITDRRQFVISKLDSPKVIDIIVYGVFRKQIFKLNVEENSLVAVSSLTSRRQYSY